MRTRLFAVVVSCVVVILSGRNLAQQGQGPSAPPRNPTPANMPLATVQDMFIRFPLPPGQETYADIDGRHLYQCHWPDEAPRTQGALAESLRTRMRRLE